jgi:glutamate racemase
MEIAKLHPDIQVTGVACPFWVPLVEYNEADSPGADYFVKKYLDQLLHADSAIDTIILGCTHYPLLLDKIRQFAPPHIQLISQGQYVAQSLSDYLRRHADMAQRLTTGGQCRFLTTEQPSAFAESATAFLGSTIEAEHISLQ